MSKILVVGNGGNYSIRQQMIAAILHEAGHDVVYERPEPEPLEVILDEYYNIPLTHPEKKANIAPSTLLVKLIRRI